MAEIDDPGFLETFMHGQLERAAAAMRETVTEVEFAQSQEEVPLEYGDLQNTGVVSEVVIDGMTAAVAIGYGHGDHRDVDIYAVVQHERSDLNHPNGRKWKYLEDPTTRNAHTFAARIAEKMR